MRHTLSIVTILFAISAAAGCSRSEAATQPAPTNTAAAAAKTPNGATPKLVFFMNPNGQPCKIQQRILDDMASELNGKVDVVKYKTTSPGDEEMFSQYGIRSLPTLVLTDSLGNEIRRGSPGIQDTAAVRRLIAQ